MTHADQGLASYRALVAAKQVTALPCGFTDVGSRDLLPGLFDHQKHCLEFALRAGRSAQFLDTGLGKTALALAWGDGIVRRTNRPVLMLAPLAVAAQHAAEAERIGVDARLSRFGIAPERACIAITNYERLERFDPADYAAVILDECFAPDTPVDVVDQHGRSSRKHIENIRIGDRILNAAGIDRVSDVHRREVPYGVRVRYAGQAVLTSPNHPFLTERGWVAAQDLVPGDTLVATAAAVRVVRRGVHRPLRADGKDALLRAVLLSEMADAPAGASGEGALAGGRRKARGTQAGVARIGRARGGGRVGAHSGAQSGKSSRSQSKDLPPIERHAARTFRAWGQRAWFDGFAGGFDGCAARDVEGGICLVTGPTDSRLSHALQDRLGEHRKANSYRGGWSFAPFARSSGRKEGGQVERYGVDGIEVLELGHPDLDRFRDADGKLYFYDLGGTRHPSFSIHGALVHNSSILKSFTGATKRRLVEAFGATPYRLPCSATPAPNDHTELGQHSEFLGVMRPPEMLSRFFIADQANAGRYRLKKPAVRPFWDWVASWARCVSRPSDLGFSDDGFVMPELVVQRHVVQADRARDAGTERDGQGRLFRIPNTSATSIHQEKRLTKDERAQRVAELVRAEPGEPWVCWVETDYDADALREVLTEAVEVRGSQHIDVKEERLAAFSTGEVRVLITKPSIAGFGLNWQHCARMAFMGLSFSYESFYQAVRRCWRFRQTRDVHAHVVCADTEASIWDVVNRKSGDHSRMKAEMAAAMARAARQHRVLETYDPKQGARLPAWMVP